MSIINHHNSQEILHQLVLLLLPKQLWMLVVGGMVVQVASHRQPIQLPHVFLGMPSIVIIIIAIITINVMTSVCKNKLSEDVVVSRKGCLVHMQAHKCHCRKTHENKTKLTENKII